MYWINWRLASLAFVTVPNVVFASKVFGNYIRKQTTKVQKALAASTAAAEEALGTVRTVKSLHAEAEMSERYAFHMAEYRRLSVWSAAAYFPFSALTYTFLPYAASCLVLYYGGKLIHRGHLSSGALVSFVFYMQSLFATFSSLGNIYGAFVE
jgi:ABC-type multidrug transport system fused ATPase/permease subunit